MPEPIPGPAPEDVLKELLDTAPTECIACGESEDYIAALAPNIGVCKGCIAESHKVLCEVEAADKTET